MVVTERVGFLISIAISMLVASLLVTGTQDFFWVKFVGITVANIPFFWVGTTMNLDVRRVARRSWKISMVVGAMLVHLLCSILVGRVALILSESLPIYQRFDSDAILLVSMLMIFPAMVLVKLIKWGEKGAGRELVGRLPVLLLVGFALSITFAF